MTRSAFSSGASAHQTRVLLLPSEILAPFNAKIDGLMEISPLVRRSGLPGPFGLMALFLITSSLFARPGKAYPRFRGASLFFVYRPGLSGLNFTATNSHVHIRRPDGVPPLAVDSARPLHRVLLLILFMLMFMHHYSSGPVKRTHASGAHPHSYSCLVYPASSFVHVLHLVQRCPALMRVA